MIPRYSLPEMASLWSDEARFSTMLEVEILAVEAWSLLGTVPAESVATIRERTAGMITTDDVAAIEERERITNHDVAAFVDVVAGRVGQPAGAWVHYGLTSSDVVDTALALQIRRAGELILEGVDRALAAVTTRAHEHKDTLQIGRCLRAKIRDQASLGEARNRGFRENGDPHALTHCAAHNRSSRQDRPGRRRRNRQAEAATSERSCA